MSYCTLVCRLNYGLFLLQCKIDKTSNYNSKSNRYILQLIKKSLEIYFHFTFRLFHLNLEYKDSVNCSSFRSWSKTWMKKRGLKMASDPSLFFFSLYWPLLNTAGCVILELMVFWCPVYPLSPRRTQDDFFGFILLSHRNFCINKSKSRLFSSEHHKEISVQNFCSRGPIIRVADRWSLCHRSFLKG